MQIQYMLILVLCTGVPTTYARPFFLAGEDPKPPGTVWQRVDQLSDEFEGDSLDTTKWQDEPIGNGWVWDGRPPGFFKASNVTVAEGRMRVTVGKLDEPVVKKGKTFTHQGAIVRSLYPGHVGWYFECRMKANQTAMSSTFWLMTKGNTKKKLELDIQECVGRTTDKTEDWGKHWDQVFHSNAIHRTNRYNSTKVQLQAQIKPETKNYQRFYVYGAWWKSPEEIRFYLDGKYAYSIHPKVAWDVPAYIQMAIEPYSWNPLPDDGGLVESGTWDQRTTQYEWVRTWKLEAAADTDRPGYGSDHGMGLPGGKGQQGQSDIGQTAAMWGVTPGCQINCLDTPELARASIKLLRFHVPRIYGYESEGNSVRLQTKAGDAYCLSSNTFAESRNGSSCKDIGR